MAPQSRQREIAMRFINTFDELDMEGHIATRSPKCRHTIIPSSLGYKPDMTNDEFAGHFKALTTVIRAFPVTSKEVLEAFETT